MLLKFWKGREILNTITKQHIHSATRRHRGRDVLQARA